jgi:hypothetical protein
MNNANVSMPPLDIQRSKVQKLWFRVFHVFLKYKKINKIKSIEIILKRTHLSKAIIINLPKMKKSNQDRG